MEYFSIHSRKFFIKLGNSNLNCLELECPDLPENHLQILGI